MIKKLVYFSGGKDSQACLIWAVGEYGAENVEAVFCDTGWESPLTYGHIKYVTDELNVKLVTLKSKKYNGMVDLAKKKQMFPSTRARFCTQELKSLPAIDYVLSQTDHVIVIQGIRMDESYNRSQMSPACTYFKYYFQPRANGKRDTYRGKEVRTWTEKYNADLIYPIFSWTAQEVIDYILESGQKINPLYKMGFSRVGCFPCIMSRKSEVRQLIKRFPEQWERLKKLEAEIGSSYFPPTYIPSYACRGISKSGAVFPWAKDVEDYVLRFDTMESLFEEDYESCMSIYSGLCE